MMQRLVGLCFVLALFFGVAILDAQEKKQTGKLTGEVKSQKPTPNGKNVFLEVLASGEETARKYFVTYDPKVKGPNQKVLEAVKASKVGDRVQLEWVDTGEGKAITAFEVLKKKVEKD